MRKLFIVFLAACLFTFVFCLRDSSFKASGQNRGNLFNLAETRGRALTEADKTSIASARESEITFNFQSLSEADAARLSFPLFDGVIYEAERTETETRALDDYTWRGKIKLDKFEGDVILTFKKGYVSGLIYAPGAVYEIVPKGEKQILVELNQSLFPECAGDVKGDAARENTKAQDNLAGADSGDRIDVLVLYTTSVRNSLGGDAQAQAFAQEAIDSTNTAYINSKIRQRVRLVRAQEATIGETGTLGTELTALRADATAAALRNTYNADLVTLISNSLDNCGIGYLMGSTTGNSNNGFTVTSRTCAVGNLSFAHELGHNMGSQHNPENGTGATFAYGYGHYVNGVFRTVMSYADPCAAGCNRVPYFSNPSVMFNDFPTGIENARDNARSINNTADTIAGYRYSGSSLTLNNYNGGETVRRLIGQRIVWSSDNVGGNVRIEISRDGASTWQTLIPSTPNDGAETINVSGRPTRQARLRVSSADNPAISDSSLNNIIIR